MTRYNLIYDNFPRITSLLCVFSVTYCLAQRPQLSQSHTYKHTGFTCACIIKHTKIFCASLKLAQKVLHKNNIPNIKIYTPTHMQTLNFIEHFNIQQHLCTSLSQFKTYIPSSFITSTYWLKKNWFHSIIDSKFLSSHIYFLLFGHDF